MSLSSELLVGAAAILVGGCASFPNTTEKDVCQPSYLEIRSGYPDFERQALCEEKQRAAMSKQATSPTAAAAAPADLPVEHDGPSLGSPATSQPSATDYRERCLDGEDSACRQLVELPSVEVNQIREDALTSVMLRPSGDSLKILDGACRAGSTEVCAIAKDTRAEQELLAQRVIDASDRCVEGDARGCEAFLDLSPFVFDKSPSQTSTYTYRAAAISCAAGRAEHCDFRDRVLRSALRAAEAEPFRGVVISDVLATMTPAEVLRECGEGDGAACAFMLDGMSGVETGRRTLTAGEFLAVQLACVAGAAKYCRVVLRRI